MKTRIISGLAMLPLLFFVYWGGMPLYLVCLCITVIALREFAGVFAKAQSDTEFSRLPRPPFLLMTIFALLLYAALMFLNLDFILFWIFFVLVASFLLMFRKDSGISDSLAAVSGTIYIIFLLAHVIMIDLTYIYHSGFTTAEILFEFRGFDGNITWLILLTAFGSDIFAYFTGVLIGKHKLCPNLSPKKTVEGFIGGIIGSTLLCAIFGYFFLDGFFKSELDIPLPGGHSISAHFIIIGALGGAVSVLGDLAASAIKRKLGVKDYGNLIPGHGGVLDRMDSVLFTAPFLFYYLQIISLVVTLMEGPVL